MTKKLSNGTKKPNTLSLREFIDQAPGQLPLESCLPSKPGDHHLKDASEHLHHKLASVPLHSNGAGSGLAAGCYGPGSYGNDHPAYTKPVAHDSDYYPSGRSSGSYGNGSSAGGYDSYGPRHSGSGFAGGERNAGGYAAGADGVYATAGFNGSYQQRGEDAYGRGPYGGHPNLDAPPRRYGGPAYPPGAPMPPAGANGYRPGSVGEGAYFPPPPPPPPPPRPAQQQQQGMEKPASPAAVPPAAVPRAGELDAQPRRGSALVDGLVSSSDHGSAVPFAFKRRPLGVASAVLVQDASCTAGVQAMAGGAKANGKLVAAQTAAEEDAFVKDQADGLPTPAASMPVGAAPEPPQQLQQTVAAPPPKNEFAARMAQAAAARMASRAHSTSLLADTPAAAAAPANTTTTNTPAEERLGSPPGATKARPTLVFKQNLGSSAAAASESSGRPKLQLQPRSLPALNGTSGSPAADSMERWGSGSIASQGSLDSTGRPRVKLLPRGATAATAGAAAATTAGAAAKGMKDSAEGAYVEQAAADGPPKRGASSGVFGAARPREQVLLERGIDPEAVLSASPAKLTEASLAARNGGRSSGSHGTSLAIGDDDVWQTVGKHGRAGRPGSGGIGSDGGAGSYSDDPFLPCGGSRANSHTRFANDIGAPHHNPHFARGNGSYNNSNGTYGSPAGSGFGGGFGGGSYGGAHEVGAANVGDEGAGLFRRSLPVRSDLLL